MATALDRLTKRELVELLGRLLTPSQRPGPGGEAEAERLIHDLEVHQVELEMQNRELRETQQELEQSRRRYADLYDLAPIVYVTLDKGGRIQEANLTATTLFGMPRGDVVGRPFAAVVEVDDRAALRDHLRRCLVDRTRAVTELTLSPPGLAPVTVQMISTPVVGPDGGLEGCKTTLTDVTSLKRTQQRLTFLTHAGAVLASSFDHESSLAEVVRMTVPTMADLCFVDLLEPEGKLRRIEVAVADRRQQALARTARGMVHRPPEQSALGRALRRAEPVMIEDCALTAGPGMAEMTYETLLRASGVRSLMFVPMLSRDGSRGVMTFGMTTSGRRFGPEDLETCRDLAVRAAMAIEGALNYASAEGASRARQDLLAFVSHDLRNPLTGILLTADMMLAAVPQEERRKGWRQLERIRRSSHQMRRMIEDLLDVTSIEAGRLSIEPKEHGIDELCNDAIELLQPLAAEKQITVRCELPPEGQVVRCDRGRSMQVFSNVLGNAIKFTPPHGTITVAVSIAPASAVFEVRDTGPGIARARLPHLFERYWQAEETARRGRGLGLFIAKGIVEAQGGSIWAESAEGRGASFFFTLPLAGAQGVPARQPRVPVSGEPGARPARSSRA